MIVNVELDEDQLVEGCTLQAIMSKRDTEIEWRDLKDAQKWKQGWK